MHTGMGRIASIWKQSFELDGHSFTHIGTDLVPNNLHYNLWGFQALAYCKKNKINADVLLVHEPIGGFFAKYKKAKLVVYSHGIEQRQWEAKHKWGFEQNRSFKSKLIPSSLRFYANNKGFKAADLILLSNSTDKGWLLGKKIAANKISIFHNGYYPFMITKIINKSFFKVLYNATWIVRKGTGLVVKVFNELLKTYPALHLTLAGTGFTEDVVLEHFSIDVRHQIQVISFFSKEEEQALYRDHDIFMLPSYFEGQSLALTQAMAMGLCPIAANNSGQTDFITHGQNGLLFNTGDAAGLLKCIVFCIENPNKVANMGMEAAQSVKELTWPTASMEILKWCKELMLNNQ
jgi:glycosyltransferase involved in cell wall biosynthesis